MNRISLFAGCLLSLAAASPTITAAAQGPAPLSVEQIIDHNIAARGGLAAWRSVKTLTIAGELDAGGKPNHTLPFLLKEKRQRKSRLEIVFKDQTAVQVYDGAQGWKVRPFLNSSEVETYKPAETKSAASEQDHHGPLVPRRARRSRSPAPSWSKDTPRTS
jgi:hypothetical protein